MVYMGRWQCRLKGGIHPKHRLMQYHHFFTERINSGEHVLDVGCGNGTLAYSIAKKSGAKVTGMDMSEENIKTARKRHFHEDMTYMLGNILTDLPEGYFDVIVMSNVLEHLEDRIGFLRTLQARAVPERWLIRVPMIEHDWRVPLKKELGLDWRLDKGHFIEYTLEKFKQEIESAGLSILYHEKRWSEIWAVLTAEGNEE